MLQGRFEWTIGLVGTVVVVMIAAWYSVIWNRGVVQRAQPAPAAAVETRQPAPAAPATLPAPAPAAAGLASFHFRAVRGEAWLQVRVASHAGRILFEGTLAQGESLHLRARGLWLRFGAASNVDLRVNGRRSAIPLFGTFDAFVTAGGVRPDPTVYEGSAPQATAAQSP